MFVLSQCLIAFDSLNITNIDLKINIKNSNLIDLLKTEYANTTTSSFFKTMEGLCLFFKDENNKRLALVGICKQISPGIIFFDKDEKLLAELYLGDEDQAIFKNYQ